MRYAHQINANEHTLRPSNGFEPLYRVYETLTFLSVNWPNVKLVLTASNPLKLKYKPW